MKIITKLLGCFMVVSLGIACDGPATSVADDDFREGLQVSEKSMAVFQKMEHWRGKRVRCYGGDVSDLKVSSGVTVTFCNTYSSSTQPTITVYYTATFPDELLEKVKFVQDHPGVYFEGKIKDISLSWPDDNPSMRVVWVNMVDCRFTDR